MGEEVISIYCSGDGASDPVQGAQGKTKYKKKKIEIRIQELPIINRRVVVQCSCRQVELNITVKWVGLVDLARDALIFSPWETW